MKKVDAIKKYNLTPIARINTRVCVGSDPIMMLDGVIPATSLALKKAGLTHSDIDVFEINEAFAVVPIAWQKTLGIDESKVNPNGGACAHGHPLGCTGMYTLCLLCCAVLCCIVLYCVVLCCLIVCQCMTLFFLLMFLSFVFFNVCVCNTMQSQW